MERDKFGKRILQGTSVTAESEQDIFDLLGLQYRAPHERNCFDPDYVRPEKSDDADAAPTGGSAVPGGIDW